MANFIFTDYRNVVMGSGTYTVPDWDTDSIGVFFVDAADDVPTIADTYVNPGIASGGQVPAFASAPNIGTVTIGSVADGVVDAADTVFTALSGDQSEWIVMFKDTGTDTTSPLLCAWDTATGLPLTPNGGDVTIAWHTSGIIQF